MNGPLTTEATQIFRDLAENLPDIVARLDRDLRHIYVNRAVESIFGVPASALIGRTDRELGFPGELADCWESTLRKVFETGDVASLEFSFAAPTGRVILESRIVPELGPDGSVDTVLTITRDVTAKYHATHAVKESEERLRAVVENTPDVIMHLDHEGRIMYINHTIPPYKVEQVLGTSCYGYVTPESARRIKPVLASVFHDGLPRAIEVEEIGGTIWLARYVPLREDGAIAWVMVISTDITELRRAEEERRELETNMLHAQKLESLGVLAGGIAHDFNNLLVGILANADMALAELPEGSRLRTCLTEIDWAAQRASELCQQMLAYSGRGKFRIESLDLNTVVREIGRLLEASICKKAVLRYFFATDLPPITADATQIRQVIMNLITNASEALGDQPGAVSIATRRMDWPGGRVPGDYLDAPLQPGVYCCLEVSDTGCGMDEFTRKKLFDPFFTTKFTGRGLGLAAVLGIVRGHRGAITVESAPGEGATFTVWFPADVSPAPRPQ